ncbi:hypothetical protein RN607_09555 [Demequina capsici]|uniref:Transcriptional regulator, AbiEi antitoxin, Type IV TA system n=1 Tax=Demequina capsici TaxID=3075620 RepID=A0AA96JC54_9MICO|nr:hypothetical protein [Demequina sp. PMTSA13]WNM26446.1 hypothetical protein RN607_09555 [Demequina sp. PMTSA13]
MASSADPTMLHYESLADHGLTRHRLRALLGAGEYERIAPGLFLRAGEADDTTAAWMAIAVKRPQATLCLLSALALHELTDEIPTRSHIAIPRGMQPIEAPTAPIAWHRFDAATFDIGRGKHELPGGLSIGLYSPERTIIDLFRLRHDWGGDLAIDALKRWLRTRGNGPASLLKMAASFPKAQPAIRNALEILL